MILYPNAKINIGLKVLNKRPDGFHNLETLFYPVEKSDILEIVEAPQLKMEQYGIVIPKVAGASTDSGGNAHCSAGGCAIGDNVMAAEDNLCIKAYKLLKQDFDIPPVEIYLHKNIPVGAGLGGGSSDAAHTILGLNELFKLGLTKPQMAQYASVLGSDCSFFIYNRPMLGEGRGEVLTQVELAGLEDLMENYRIELVHPPYFVSTAQAYGGIVPRDKKQAAQQVSGQPSSGGFDEVGLVGTGGFSADCMQARRQYEVTGFKADSQQAGCVPADGNKPLTELLQRPVTEWKDIIVNDFEETVFEKIPQLREYKEALYKKGATYAAMSGSGSTMFGIFKK